MVLTGADGEGQRAAIHLLTVPIRSSFFSGSNAATKRLRVTGRRSLGTSTNGDRKISITSVGNISSAGVAGGECNANQQPQPSTRL